MAGIALSIIWVTGVLAFTGTSDATSTFSESFRAKHDTVSTAAPLDTLPPPVTTMPHIASPAGTTSTPATGDTIPIVITPEISAKKTLRVPVDPQTWPSEATDDEILRTEYRYYERGPRITDLQKILGLSSVDGVYGPVTRRAHIETLGGPSAAVIIFYPELFEVSTPCSHGCIPGDGHYELPTLGELVDKYFKPRDRAIALEVAFCESSAHSSHIGSTVVSHAYAIGWFQHLAKYWPERSVRAGWGDYHPFHAEANVAVAAWLYYSSGIHHWNPSKACWGDSRAYELVQQ
jgi:hypothetical protein